MRVTQGLAAEAVKSNLRVTNARLFAAQTRVSTAISKPSDDPGQVSRLLALKRNADEISQYGKNV